MSTKRDRHVDSDAPWLVALLLQVPPCFDKRSWTSYVAGVIADARQMRGTHELDDLAAGRMPAYCAECSLEQREAQFRAGRCFQTKMRRP